MKAFSKNVHHWRYKVIIKSATKHKKNDHLGNSRVKDPEKQIILLLYCHLYMILQKSNQTRSPPSLYASVLRVCAVIYIISFLFFFPTDKTIKLWKISERDKRPEGYNLKEEDGRYKDSNTITSLRVQSLKHTWPVGYFRSGITEPDLLSRFLHRTEK